MLSSNNSLHKGWIDRIWLEKLLLKTMTFIIFYGDIEMFFFFRCRRQSERNKLTREKQLREAAEREKNALEQQMMHYQEESRTTNEQLVTQMHWKIN